MQTRPQSKIPLGVGAVLWHGLRKLGNRWPTTLRTIHYLDRLSSCLHCNTHTYVPAKKKDKVVRKIASDDDDDDRMRLVV